MSSSNQLTTHVFRDGKLNSIEAEMAQSRFGNNNKSEKHENLKLSFRVFFHRKLRNPKSFTLNIVIFAIKMQT